VLMVALLVHIKIKGNALHVRFLLGS